MGKQPNEIEPRGEDYSPKKLKAPFPYNGGKSAVAGEVWDRFGAPKQYIEPFFGSGAVWWNCPYNINGIVNDLNPFICNFWRAIECAPKETAHYARWPIIETDLYARQVWLNSQVADLKSKLEADHKYCDPEMAGIWAWVISSVIGPACIAGRKVYHQKPHLTKFGGVNSFESETSMAAYFELLKAKTERLKVCTGDWKRVVTPCVLQEHSTTAILLDPPYNLDMRDNRLYFAESDVAKEVATWAIAHGHNPKLRIALCGYEGEHAMPDNWSVYRWQANGGMGNTGNNRGKENKKLETIWFSPHCLRPTEMLF
jgi:DNA adenine methylase